MSCSIFLSGDSGQGRITLHVAWIQKGLSCDLDCSVFCSCVSQASMNQLHIRGTALWILGKFDSIHVPGLLFVPHKDLILVRWISLEISHRVECKKYEHKFSLDWVFCLLAASWWNPFFLDRLLKSSNPWHQHRQNINKSCGLLSKELWRELFASSAYPES